MSDDPKEKKRSRFREVEREPDPRIVEEAEELLAQAKAGKLKRLAAIYELEGEEMAISQFIEVGEDSRTRLQFIGQFFMASLTLAMQIMGSGENR